MLISVIIPCLNAEKYLGRCLKSVLRVLVAVDGKCEVILVDNGSKDDTLGVAAECGAEFRRAKIAFLVLNCNAPGASAARNLGVDTARGKYIWFVDADDEVAETAAAKLVAAAQAQDADIVMMGAKRIYGDGHTDYLSAVRADDAGWRSRFVRYGAGPWQFLLKRAWWDEHGFRFAEGIIHEDMELISSLVLYTDKFADVDAPLYLYYQNDDSVLHKKNWDEHYLDIFPALAGLYSRFEAAGAAKKYHDELEWFFIWNLLIDSAKDFARHAEGKVGFSRSREMLREYFPRWRRNKFLRAKPLKLQMRVRANYWK